LKSSGVKAEDACTSAGIHKIIIYKDSKYLSTVFRDFTKVLSGIFKTQDRDGNNADRRKLYSY
jgi:hypothetical protein